MELRKLQKTADGTYFVTLPKPWVTRAGLDRGSFLSFVEREDGMILVGPHGEKERRIQAITLSPSPMLEREIEEKYLLGYDVIEVESKDMIGSDVRERVKRVLKLLVGLEIVEENARKILMQCLIEPSLLVPDKIILRLQLITSAMQKDAVTSLAQGDTKLANTVIERDEEVDRLYFLLVRLVRAAISQPSIGQRLSTTPIDCLDYRLLASFIESFGDYSVMVARETLSSAGRRLPSRATKHLESIGETIHRMYREASNAVMARDLKKASDATKIHDDVRKLLGELEKTLLDFPKEVVERMTPVISVLNRMCELSVDIADLAITR